MSRALRFCALLLVVAFVAATACYLTCRFVSGNQARGEKGSGSGSAHQWIHRELKLTASQDSTLHPIEQRYAVSRTELAASIRAANAELARAIREDRADSPKVAAAVDKIHRAQGELQKVTLDHVFEMRQALNPEQYDKLLDLTATALETDGKP